MSRVARTRWRRDEAADVSDDDALLRRRAIHDRGADGEVSFGKGLRRRICDCIAID